MAASSGCWKLPRLALERAQRQAWIQLLRMALVRARGNARLRGAGCAVVDAPGVVSHVKRGERQVSVLQPVPPLAEGQPLPAHDELSKC